MDRPPEEQCTSLPASRAATDEGERRRVAEDDVESSGSPRARAVGQRSERQWEAPGPEPADLADQRVGFERFFRAEADALLRMCWLLTLDREAAADIAQETMTRAWSSWDSLAQPDANPAGWCRTVAANLARSRWRRLQRVARRPRAAVAPAPASVGDPALLLALRELPDRQREVVVLRYWGDLLIRDCAAVMGVSVGTAKQHLTRAHERLGATLDPTTIEELTL